MSRAVTTPQAAPGLRPTPTRVAQPAHEPHNAAIFAAVGCKDAPLGPFGPELAHPDPASHEVDGTHSAGLVDSSTSTTLNFTSNEFTRISRLSRSVKVAAHCIGEALQKGGFRYRAALITATYAPGQEWHARDITQLTNNYQTWAKRKGFTLPIVWVAELTKAGVVHYHLMLWVPRGVTPPFGDKGIKKRWWSKGLTNSQWSFSPVGYLAKYASKGTTNGHQFPKGCRLHGRAGISAKVSRAIVYKLAPLWLKELVPEAHGVERVTRQWYAPNPRWKFDRGRYLEVRGWWRDLKTRMCFRTPWVGTFVPGVGVSLERRPVVTQMFAEPA